MRRGVAGLVGATLLGGCSLAPHDVRPAPPVPAAWPTGPAYAPTAGSALSPASYQEVFRDARLRTLIGQALANNRDLRVAAANVAAAQAQVRVVRAAQLPQIGVSAGGAYGRSAVAGGGTVDSASWSLQGGVSSFELDLFGRLANATAAQRDRALATAASARTVRLGLIANLANAWAGYAADRDLLAIADATVANAGRSVQLTRLRLEGGVAPRTDLSQALQVLETARGDVARQTAALAQDENLVRLLIGGDVDRALLPGNLDQALAAAAPLPAGVSSDILLRRPDVVQAEYGLRAANADIGVARARLFPSISLTGLLGFASRALGSLFAGGAFRYSTGSDASYAIFSGGAATANVAVSRAQRDAALATYEGSIQTAFREVADALADAGTLDERLRAASANTAAAADTLTLTEAQYRVGTQSYLALLIAQRSLYAARQQEASVRLAVVNNRVTLYRVLGGDAGT